VRTIAVINQKGGSGKTTTAINLAAVFAARSQPTLLVDVDPQSHCALGLAIPESQIDAHIGDFLVSEHRAPDLSRLLWRINKHLDLAPSTTRLAGLEAARGGLADLDAPDSRLSRLLARLAGDYAWCLIDCPPSIGLLTFNALRAADEVLIPVETGYFALRGAAKQIATIQAVSRRLNQASPFRVVATMHDSSSAVSVDVLEELRKQYAVHIAPVVIRFDPHLKEAASLGVPVIEHAPTSPGAADYAALASWISETTPAGALAVSPDRPVEVMAPESAEEDQEMPCDEEKPGETDDSGSKAAVSTASFTAPTLTATVASPRPMSRAAELAARTRRLLARSDELHRRLATDPRVARTMDDLAPDGTEHAAADNRVEPTPASARLFGVHQTSRGVLFVHPAPADVTVAIAGEHNNWSPTATVMRYNRKLGVHEAIVPLPPGRHKYRLVVNGVWMTDPYNPVWEPNPFGERDSCVTVAPRPTPRRLADGSD